MRINEIVAKASESNGLVGKTLFGLIIGSEYGVNVKDTIFTGTFYGIEDRKLILRSGTQRTETTITSYERAEISLGSRPKFYPL
ncbi:MAG: hypothetical protein Q8R18_00575 [bacterium]|nr:hypothetical protein [bacterium]